MANAQAAVAERRASLTTAWRTLRTFELAEESRRERHEQEVARREQRQLDEIAVIARARADAAAR
ncbi:MAG: flagellar FliJ family protein [Defluviicoccus sp.]|nr:MAG: flagellar FliJ family protein [Defluviicoccus sp.]